MFAFDHIRAFYWHSYQACPDTDLTTAEHSFNRWESYSDMSHMEDGTSCL